MAFSLKDYQIIGEIGRGGFASVYRARQKSLSREVAIKCLSPQRTQNETEIVRFRREAEAMASLTHDNILAVYDYAFFNGSYYIVMEYIDGMPFDRALSAGGFPRQCAMFVLEKVAGALRYAHAENIIHRDIKPANILLGRNGQVKLADFGLALFQTGLESFSSPASVLGTISYMAPEALVSPKDVDARIDAFSLGCLLYQVICGTLPFTGDSFGEISFHLLNSEPKPLAADPPALASITMRCLRKERENRPSMAEIHEALKAALRDGYHAAQESLISFVRNESPALPKAPPIPPDGAALQKDTPDDPPEAVPQKPPALRKKPAPPPGLVVAAGTIVLAFAGFLGFHFLWAGKVSVPLPELPALQQGGPQVETIKSGSGRPLTNDGPAPLTAAPLSEELATLVLAGLDFGDTVFINDKKEQSRRQYQLAPGRCRLEVRRKTGRPKVVKELELLPYERQAVDLTKEGTAHDRNTAK